MSDYLYTYIHSPILHASFTHRDDQKIKTWRCRCEVEPMTSVTTVRIDTNAASTGSTHSSRSVKGKIQAYFYTRVDISADIGWNATVESLSDWQSSIRSYSLVSVFLRSIQIQSRLKCPKNWRIRRMWLRLMRAQREDGGTNGRTLNSGGYR